MARESSEIWHYISIIWTVIGAIAALGPCNEKETDVRGPYGGSVPPSKGNDHLEEAMEQLNQKRPPIAKGFHHDTLNYVEAIYDMQIRAVYPTSDLPELKAAHALLINELKEEINTFIADVKSAGFQSERLYYQNPNEIRIAPHKEFFGVGRLSYLFKMEARDKEQHIAKDKWVVFNYDLVNQHEVSFQDFFKLQSDHSKKRFLEILFGHDDLLAESDLNCIEKFPFFFNKHEIAFLFNKGQFPFTSYTLNLVTVKHNDLKEFITPRYQLTYLEARPNQ